MMLENLDNEKSVQTFSDSSPIQELTVRAHTYEASVNIVLRIFIFTYQMVLIAQDSLTNIFKNTTTLLSLRNMFRCFKQRNMFLA